MTTSSPRIVCGACGKSYAWTTALAGRKVKCRCGQVMTAPTAPVAERDESDLYDVAPDPDVAQRERSPAPLTSTVVTTGSAAHAVSYARRETVGETAVDRYFPDRVKDLYLPLGLIAGGTVIEVLIAVFGSSMSLHRAFLGVGAYVIVNTVLMLATVFVVAKIWRIGFGPVPTAIIKLCGISIGPGAIGSVVSLVLGFLSCIGALIGWLVGCVLYFALIGALFDLEETETWTVCISVFIVKLLLVVFILRML